MINQNLINQAVRFLQWAQALEDVVIPAGLEEDMKEAIKSAQQDAAAELPTSAGNQINIVTMDDDGRRTAASSAIGRA